MTTTLQTHVDRLIHPAGFDSFFDGYLTALAFTGDHYENEEDARDGQPESFCHSPGQDIRDVLDLDKLREQLTAASELTRCRREALLFLRMAGGLLDHGNEEELFDAGSDFHFSRNGHGCGFWDGDWSEPWASKLDALAKTFSSERELEQIGEVIYVSG